MKKKKKTQQYEALYKFWVIFVLKNLTIIYKSIEVLNLIRNKIKVKLNIYKL